MQSSMHHPRACLATIRAVESPWLGERMYSIRAPDDAEVQVEVLLFVAGEAHRSLIAWR